MIHIEDVSSPFVVPGSDRDFTVYVAPEDWAEIAELFEDEGLGCVVRPGVVRVEPAPDVEVFVTTSGEPYDDRGAMVSQNVRAMRGWPVDVQARYLAEKQAIAHLRGHERKAAKALLAARFDLHPQVYAQ